MPGKDTGSSQHGLHLHPGLHNLHPYLGPGQCSEETSGKHRGALVRLSRRDNSTSLGRGNGLV